MPLHPCQPVSKSVVSNHPAYDIRVVTSVPKAAIAVGVIKTSCVNDDICSEAYASFQGVLQSIISYNGPPSSTQAVNQFCQCIVEPLEAE